MRAVAGKIFYAGIVIFWVVTMSLLLSRHYGPHKNIGRTVQGGSVPDSLCGEQWMGVYYRNDRIGYSRRNFEKREGGYKMSETTKMNINVFGAKKQMEMITNAYLDRDLKLDSFDLSFDSGVSMHVSGRMEGKKLHLSFDIGGRRTEEVLPLDDVPSLNFSWEPGIFREGLKTGRKFSLAIFDPLSLSRGEMFLEVRDKERVPSMGGTYEAFKIRATLKGVDFHVWITEKGEVIKEESPMGFTLIREKKEDALRTGSPSADIIEEVSVPFNIDLPDDTRYLKVRLSGIDYQGLEINGGRQNLRGDILEVRRENLDPKAGTRPVTQGMNIPGEYLENTLLVQSKDPRIVSLSKEIAGDVRDKATIAKRIYEWVYKNIEKTPSLTVPAAAEVLRTKKGDCNEHTTLFTALSRAAGIPTRMALGLTCKERRFYYHAWPEIFVGQWIAVDPTLGQFPADAAHIRLITGDIDRQMRILPVISKIKIEALEYR